MGYNDTMTTINEQIKQALEGCGLSRYRISKLTGIHIAMLSRFLRGETSMTVETMDRLAPVLGLKVTVDPKVSRKFQTPRKAGKRPSKAIRKGR